MIDLDKLAEEWPSPFVARSKIEEFTKGLYKASTIRSFDSAGTGIKPKYKINKKVFYKVKDVIAWLRTKKEKKNV